MVSYLQVLLASIIGFGIGALWYSPVLFGERWMKLMVFSKQKNRKDVSVGPAQLVLGFVVTLMLVGVQSFLFYVVPLSGIVDALLLSFIVWLGFTVAPLFSSVLWEKMSAELFWIKAMHYFAVLMVSAVILAF